ncbi:hypothetical protein B5X24_HaOG214950 [Helicoverpa armigera]|uniref:Uncharacterized protein n=1 Tax=Helicoverpa armigera TaxID=29058 RepID=A0A2W1B833_HELAM|nr:hypothetical protein B5X24_HaOG214950 [Helicoverpa armigera]
MSNERTLKLINLCDKNDPPDTRSPPNEVMESTTSKSLQVPASLDTSSSPNEVLEVPASFNLSRCSSRSTCSATTLSLTLSLDTSETEHSDSDIESVETEECRNESNHDSTPSTSNQDDIFYGDMSSGIRRRRKADKKSWKKNLNKRESV